MFDRLFVGAGVVGGVLLALWFSTVVAMGPPPAGGRLAQKAEQSKQAQGKQTDTSPDQQSSTIAKEQQQGSAKESECSNEGQPSYYDCLIQLRTARATEQQADWAQISAWVAGTALIFAAVAAAAALWTVGIMRDTARKQLRAYISVQAGNLEFAGRVPAALHFSLTNTGQTPAYNLIQFNSFLFLPHPLPADFDPGEPDDGTGETTNVLAAKETRPARRILGRPMGAEREAQLRAGTHRWYMFVVIRYRDVFRKKTRNTRLCVSLPSEQMVAYLDAAAPGATMDCRWDLDERYNDAD